MRTVAHVPVVVPVVERGSGSAGNVSDARASRSPLAPGSHTESLSSRPSELAVLADPCRAPYPSSGPPGYDNADQCKSLQEFAARTNAALCAFPLSGQFASKLT